MKTIEEIKEFKYKIDEIWSIISDISRSDWVPGVENITLDGDIRIFEMEGMGELEERIISCNDLNYELKYSAIKTSVPIKHHLAVIRLTKVGDKTVFNWSTEIEPEIFADAIQASMKESLKGLQQVLDS